MEPAPFAHRSRMVTRNDLTLPSSTEKLMTRGRQFGPTSDMHTAALAEWFEEGELPGKGD